jgi:hypothetical protein
MAITFSSTDIPGSHLLMVPSFGYQRQQNEVFGSQGATVLVGQTITREIVIDSWIYDPEATEGDPGDFPDGGSVQDFLDGGFASPGDVDTLEETGNLTRTFDNCEYKGYEPILGPLPPGGTIFSWWIHVKLHFLQLQAN